MELNCGVDSIGCIEKIWWNILYCSASVYELRVSSCWVKADYLFNIMGKQILNIAFRISFSFQLTLLECLFNRTTEKVKELLF